MNLKTIDVNLLSLPLENIAYEHDKKETTYRLQKAFEFYEEMILANKIRSYGITCKQGSYPEEETDHIRKMKDISDEHKNSLIRSMESQNILDIREIRKIAKSVGGENHGFRYVFSSLSKDVFHSLVDRYIKLPEPLEDTSFYGEIFPDLDMVSLSEYCKIASINYIGQNHRHCINDMPPEQRMNTEREQINSFEVYKNISATIPFTK